MSGTVNDRLNFGTSVSQTYGDNASMNLNAQYRTNFTTVGGSYSVSDQYQQAMVSARGNIVAHSKGVLLDQIKAKLWFWFMHQKPQVQKSIMRQVKHQ